MDLAKSVLGIELGSTRIKAVLIDENHVPFAAGSYEWENTLSDGIWTYSLDQVHEGLQACYADLRRDVREKYNTELKEVAAIGMALLAAYMIRRKAGERLPDYLDNKVFKDARSSCVKAEASDVAGFNIFLTRYKKALAIEEKAVELL